MTDPTIPQRVLFPELFGKPVVAAFDREAGELRRRSGAAEGGRAGGTASCSSMPGRQAYAGDRHTLAESDRSACLRHRVRSSGRKRCSPRTPSTLLLDRDPVGVFSQRCRQNGVALYRMGRELAENRASPATSGSDATDHDRPGPDRRPDARGAAAHLIQRGSTTTYLPLLAS